MNTSPHQDLRPFTLQDTPDEESLVVNLRARYLNGILNLSIWVGLIVLGWILSKAGY